MQPDLYIDALDADEPPGTHLDGSLAALAHAAALQLSSIASVGSAPPKPSSSEVVDSHTGIDPRQQQRSTGTSTPGPPPQASGKLSLVLQEPSGASGIFAEASQPTGWRTGTAASSSSTTPAAVAPTAGGAAAAGHPGCFPGKWRRVMQRPAAAGAAAGRLP